MEIPNDDSNKKDESVRGKKEKKTFKYKNVDDYQVEIFLKLLKKWLIKYNNFSEDKSKTHCTQEGLYNNLHSKTSVILNSKANFARVKIFIDCLEMAFSCSQMANEMITDFSKFSKLVQNLVKKILLTSEKIDKETTVFVDILLLNYPFLLSKMNFHNFSIITKADEKKGTILGFHKAHVVKAKPPAYLLWSKKILYGCGCKGKGMFFQKTFNIYKNEKNFNTNVYDTFCDLCKKEYIHDKNADVFIECQEVTLVADTEEDCLINNLITVWTYGDLINSLQEGSSVSLIAFYLPSPTKTTFEKDFEFGRFVALNFNVYFDPMAILNEKNFAVQFPKNEIGNVLTKVVRNDFSSKFNENIEIEILRSVKFQKQLNANMNKFFLSNFIYNSKKGLVENYGKDSFSYKLFLNLALDLSIVQRDYLNKLNKAAFFEEEELNRSKNKISLNDNSQMTQITQSRNIAFKSKIFDNTNYKSKQKREEEIYKYFRLARQTDFQKLFENTQANYVSRPLNLFLIFDSLSTVNNELISVIFSYPKAYSSLISVYPFINSSKFNKESLIRYFLTHNGGIIIIPDVDLLSKAEVDLIASLDCNSGTVNYNNLSNLTSSNAPVKLNISFWICCSYYKLCHAKKGGKTMTSQSLFGELKSKTYQPLINKCEIVLNFSSSFNSLRAVEVSNKGLDLEIKDYNFLSEFTAGKSEGIISGIEEEMQDLNLNVIKKNDFFDDLKLLKQVHDAKLLDVLQICKENHFFNKNQNQNEDFNDSFSAAKLMEDYFIIKRNLSRINFDDLVNKLLLSYIYFLLKNSSPC